jgi:hypothetical protein
LIQFGNLFIDTPVEQAGSDLALRLVPGELGPDAT